MTALIIGDRPGALAASVLIAADTVSTVEGRNMDQRHAPDAIVAKTLHGMHGSLLEAQLDLDAYQP